MSRWQAPPLGDWLFTIGVCLAFVLAARVLVPWLFKTYWMGVLFGRGF